VEGVAHKLSGGSKEGAVRRSTGEGLLLLRDSGAVILEEGGNSEKSKFTQSGRQQKT
jgi:hypothetical protein